MDHPTADRPPEATGRQTAVVASILLLCLAAIVLLVTAPPQVSGPAMAGLEAIAITAAMISAGARAWLTFRGGRLLMGGLLWTLAVFLMLLSLPAWGSLFGSL